MNIIIKKLPPCLDHFLSKQHGNLIYKINPTLSEAVIYWAINIPDEEKEDGRQPVQDSELNIPTSSRDIVLTIPDKDQEVERQGSPHDMHERTHLMMKMTSLVARKRILIIFMSNRKKNPGLMLV